MLDLKSIVSGLPDDPDQFGLAGLPTYAVESYHVRRLVENELGLPYLRMETDYSPADSAGIATRVEALVETVRARAGRA